MSDESHIELGVIARAHGIRGQVAVRLHNASSDTISKGLAVRLIRDSESLDARVIAVGGSLPLLEVEGVGDRDQAESLVGARIVCSRASVPVENDEILYADLEGCEVWQNGTCLGAVSHVFSAGASDVLVIEGDDGERLVPFVDDWVSVVDVEKKRIDLAEEGEWEPS